MNPEPRTIRVRAFAKLNLGLRVLYKREDNYHELRTVFQTISLADRIDISFAPAATTSIRVDGTPHIPDNLVESATRLVLEALCLRADVRFDLRKIIPAGAGLGGGSSDAAAVLLALPVLARRALPPDKLHWIAAQLGSDVPFFLEGGAALGLGRGEELYPLPDLPAMRGLLVVPDIHSSTPEAYRDLSLQLTSFGLQNKLSSFRHEVWRGVTGDAADSYKDAVNDFEEVVFARHPELREIKDRLLEFGAKPAAMTGSGSAIFGMFREASRLERAKVWFDASFPGSRVFPISLVSRAQYRSAWRRALKLHVEGSQWPPRSLHVPSPSAQ